MIGKPFINDVINKAIEDYLKFKATPDNPLFSTFPVMAIRTLIYIYGELDIINPYITRNEQSLGGFDSNLTKYGFQEEKVEDFKNAFLSYQELLVKNVIPNSGMLMIQKYLMEMYLMKEKNMHLDFSLEEEFKSYLYISSNPNPYIQKDLSLLGNHANQLQSYFQSIAYEMHHNFSLEEERRTVYPYVAYQVLGYNINQINALSDVDLKKVNENVLNFFRINKEELNKEEMLLKAISYYQKYGNRLTSGNGYVDMLLFLSVLVTTLFITFLAFWKLW